MSNLPESQTTIESVSIIVKRFHFGKSEPFILNDKVVKGLHFDFESRPNAFDPKLKTKVLKLAIFNKKNKICKYAYFLAAGAKLKMGEVYKLIKVQRVS